eukprot:g5623.t1
MGKAQVQPSGVLPRDRGELVLPQVQPSGVLPRDRGELVLPHEHGYRAGEGRRRRRVWRVSVFLCTSAAAFGTFVGVCALFAFSQSYSWDVASDLLVNVRGCDVRIEPDAAGAAATLSIERFAGRDYWDTLAGNALAWDSSGTYVNVATVRNSGGCAADGAQSCAPLCLVTVRVPALGAAALADAALLAATGGFDARRVWVVQEDDDEAARISVVAGAGVSVQELRVDGPAADVALTGVRAHTLVVRGVRGPVAATDCVFDSCDLRALHSSVLLRHTVTGIAAPVPQYTVRYRASENGACVAGAQGVLSVAAQPAWDPAPVEWTRVSIDTADTSDAAEWWRRRALAHYDGNGDSWVTLAEFSDGLARLPKCCADACPVRSSCLALEAALFPTATGDDGRTGVLTDAVFLQRLADANDTTLVPLAAAALVAAAATTATAATTAATAEARLVTDSGSVRVELGADDSEGLDFGTAGAWLAASGTRRGLTLGAADAARLMAVRDVFGATAATADLFLLLDVPAAAGVPAARFVYATRPIFLHVEPAYLTFLSAGLLRPEVRRERVSFANRYCDANATADVGAGGDAAAVERRAERLAEMYAALRSALLPRFQPELRGVLVRLREDHQPAPLSASIEAWRRQFPTVEGGSEAWVAEDFAWGSAGTAEAGVYLSLVLGALLSLLVMALSVRKLSRELRRKVRADGIKARLMGIDSVDGSEVGQDIAQAPPAQEAAEAGAAVAAKAARSRRPRRSAKTVLTNPFLMPLDLIEIVLLAPLRRRLVDSVQRFVDEMCEVAVEGGDTDGAGGAGSSARDSPAPSMPYEVFAERYSHFCYRHDLLELTEYKQVQRRLLLKHGVR